ncbi:MAG: ABC transporter permease [Bacteroidetes bacterium]|nr:ABC transporter permease [Bacteroidota bacterium]
MWSNFLKTTLRSLSKNKSYTLVNILGLSIALAVFIALVLYLQFELSFDNFQQNSDRLYRVEQIMIEGGREERMVGTPTPTAQAMIDKFPEIESSIRFIYKTNSIKTPNGDDFEVKSILTDNDFFKMFTYPILKGDMNNALTEPYSIVLSETLAKVLFANEDPLGKTLNNNGVTYKITAILKDPPKNSHLDFNALQSANTLTETGGDRVFKDWGSNWVRCYIMLKPNHNIEAFNAKIKNILKVWWNEKTENQLLTRPVKEIHLYSKITDDYAVRGSINSVYVLSALALFILIMAGVNFTNLSIAYSTRRTKEVGLRKIIGANKPLLICQFMAESLLIAVFSMIIAFVLFETLLPWFNQIVNRELDFEYIANFKLLALIIGITILLGFFSGIYPALIIANAEPLSVLKLKDGNKSNKSFLRKFLVGIQFIISASFIIGAIGIYQQVNYMQNKDLGYNVENVLRINVDGASMKNINFFRDQILQNPNIINASVHDYPISNSTNWTRFAWDVGEERKRSRINNNHADQYFIDTYKMKLISGEGFIGPQIDTTVEGNLGIINEAALKIIGFEDPIGKKILYGGDYRGGVVGNRITIVGVVKDFHFKSAHNEITPMIIRLFNKNDDGWSVSVRISPTDISQTISFLNAQFKIVFPELLFEYKFVENEIANLYQEEMKLTEVILYLALLAIIIACLGIYGLISFTTNSRTKEIGIRKALGSNALSINYLFAKEYLSLILIANIISWPISYYILGSWLNSFPYQMPFSIFPYIVAIGITIFFSFLSMIYRLLRAINTNTVDSLRHE